MKNLLGIVVATSLALFVASAAHASIVMTTDISTAGVTPTFSYSELKGTTLVDLDTNITDITSNLTIKRGNALFYTNSKGVAQQIIGTTTATVLKNSSSVSLVNNRGPELIISNNATSKNTGSYLYNVSTKKTKGLKPVVTSITQGSIAPNGQWLALLGKNTKGQTRLFVSTTSIEKLHEYSLPKKATKCLSLAIAPDSATLALACEFLQADTTTVNGLVLRKFTANALGTEQKYIDQSFALYSIAWKDKSTVVGIGYGPTAQGTSVRGVKLLNLTMKIQEASPFAAGLHEYAIKNGKVSKRTADTFSTSDIVDTSMFVLPMQLFLSSKNVVDYMALYIPITESDPSLFKSYLGRYNLSTKVHSVLLKNDQVNLFSEYPAVAT